MAESLDPYAILQVDPRAPLAEIRAAYRTLARQHHPDFLEWLARAPAGRRYRGGIEALLKSRSATATAPPTRYAPVRNDQLVAASGLPAKSRMAPPTSTV